MRTELFHYDLPQDLIAQEPLPREQSRLLVLHRQSDTLEHRHFCDLLSYLEPNDTLVLNDTRVTARRLVALRSSGLPAELLLLRPVGADAWDTLVKPGRGFRIGQRVTVLSGKTEATSQETAVAEVVGETPEGGRRLLFESEQTRDRLLCWGETPLPPYIHKALPPENEERYQTVYAQHGGSVAAPTAGLHFTPELLKQIEAKGVAITYVTLHVGTGTFRPVRAERIEEHEMHYEFCALSAETAKIVQETQGRVIAVGTTSVRTLETAAKLAAEQGSPLRVVPFSGETNIFITPGFAFRVVDALITNFHLPCSTLLMLVSAFATHEQMMQTYRVAVQERYRFFSFGDAMMIL